MSDIETHPLPPFLPPNAKLLMLGSFPPPATRWKMNKFLEIVVPTNIEQLLSQMPQCNHIMTTGDKATDTMMLSMPEGTLKPSIGQPSQAHFVGRDLYLYRMPSSSRAYPVSLEKKAESYRTMFEHVGLV